MQRISSAASQPLHSVAATRQIEQQAAASLPPHTLMQRAGLAAARLTLALAPHAQRIWVACGPGNNGGDGFEAALQLHQWGKTVVLSWTGPTAGRSQPPDAAASRQRAVAAGVPMAEQPPGDFDFCIDALLGIGARADTALTGSTLQWLRLMQASPAPCLAIDVPTGLDADTGTDSATDAGSASAPRGAIKSIAVTAYSIRAKPLFCLSLLTLKPGLFTAHGRDRCGEVWFDDLGVDTAAQAPQAWLAGADRVHPPRGQAPHASHKGTFGDVAIVGGQSSPAGPGQADAGNHMSGAALLAGRAALHAGAGRVFVALLGHGGAPPLQVDPLQPELMFRGFEALDLVQQVLVCGCGGGSAVKRVMAKLLSTAPRAVLDADALNAIAQEPQLQTLLMARQHRGYGTVLTPHPLEAARLAGLGTAQVQADRLATASALASRFGCVVVLKGSGTVVAAPGQATAINASGNARLATPGTGDVLAGMLGAYWASGLAAFDAACSAVFAHGHLADRWAADRPGETLTASALAAGIREIRHRPEDCS
ncbi:NAD(P)H-hydrate dehydratase [Polaromonas sp.]|uniref:NAD(P)H-hydrate dehydratase n=1 Tax=Polaromonas sp. TaxID=1869339 RepID=UPI00286C9DDB|nr:NAD(P)H-hydrate dehydratase [Polaromonas sp.]